MAGTGLEPIFPVWGLPTRPLAEEMIAAGVRAKLTCVNTTKLEQSFLGREFDQTFLSTVSVGMTVVRDNFAFADLI